MAKEHIDTTLSTVSIDGTDIGGISPGSLPFPEPKRDTKDVTTIKDTVKRKGLKILDPGDTKFSGIYIPGDAGQIALYAASNDAQEHTIQITVPEAGLVFEYQAYVAADYPTEEDENTLSLNVNLEVTGGFVRSTAFAGITSIAGSGVGITHYPSTAGTALGEDDNDVFMIEASGVSTDSLKVTAASSSYIGVSYNNGLTWTKLTSGTGSAIPSTVFPAAGELAKALVKVTEDGKATRFVNVTIGKASA